MYSILKLPCKQFFDKNVTVFRFLTILSKVFESKSQLILKFLFGVFNFFQKTSENKLT